MAGIVVKPRARIFHGHEWIYASEVLKTFGNPADGDVVSLKDGKDRLLGSAIYNSKSQIVARRFSRRRQELDADFFRRRIQLAIKYRHRRGINQQLRRLVWSESDGLPGVVVDQYGEVLVLQTLTLAMDQRREMIADALFELLQPRSIVERNDVPIRRAESLEIRTGILRGEKPEPREFEMCGVRFTIDPLHGQKTGFYLDQRENYAEVSQFAAGRGVLDCFAHQGAFALTCARAGASKVTAVEINADCVRQIEQQAARNELQLHAVAANAFDFLKAEEQKSASYDLIILDPPSFTKSRQTLKDAMRGYKEIHLRALKLLSPDGLLATFSCSHHVSSELFKEMISEALVDAKKTARQLRALRQSADHPILVNIPETEYLKGFLLELLPSR